MRALAGLIFAAILTPLGVRLVLPFFADSLPEFAAPVVELLVWWTDLLVIPFAAFELPRALTSGAGLAFGRAEPQVVVALVGWSIVEAVVLGVLGLFGRRRTDATRAATDSEEAP